MTDLRFEPESLDLEGALWNLIAVICAVMAHEAEHYGKDDKRLLRDLRLCEQRLKAIVDGYERSISVHH